MDIREVWVWFRWCSDQTRDKYTADITRDNKEETKDRVRTQGDPDLMASQQLTEYRDTEEILDVENKGATAKALWTLMNPLPDQEQMAILSRSYLVSNFTWSTQARWTEVLKLNLPGVLLSVPQIASRLEYFGLFRCKGVRLRIKINSTLMHYGRLVVGAVPGHIIGAQGLHNFPIQSANNDAVIISAMTGAEVTIEYDWALGIQWIELPIETSEAALVRQVKFVVLRPLMLSSEAVATPVTVSVFAEFMEPELTAMKHDTYTYAVPTSAVDMSETVLKSIDSLNILDDETSDTLHGVVNFAANAIDVGTKVAEVAAILDKPTDASASSPMHPQYGSDLPYTQGLDSSVKLATNAAANVAVEEGFAGPELPSQPLARCMSKPGYVAEGVFSSITPVNTVVMSFLVHPLLTYTSGEQYYPSYLGWFASQFGFWRGSINYHVMFTCAKFVTCRVRITYFPMSKIASSVGQYSGDVISQVIDIAGDTTFSFSVPYVQKSAYLPVSNFQDYTLDNNGSNGCVGIELINLVATPDSAASSIFIDVWSNAGEDFQTDIFTGSRLYLNGRQYDTTLTSLIEDRDPEYPIDLPQIYAEETSAVNSFNDDVIPIIDFLGGYEEKIVSPEMYDCVTSLCKRYSEYSSSNYGVIPTNAPSSVVGVVPKGAIDDTTNFNHIVWLTAPFVFQRGGYRFRVYFPKSRAFKSDFTPVPSNGFGVGFSPKTGSANDTYTSILAPGFLFNNSDAQYLAFEVPYFQPFSAIHVDQAYPYFDSHSATLLHAYFDETVAPPSHLGIPWQQFFYSVADDFSLGCLCSPPRITLTAPPLLESEEQSEHINFSMTQVPSEGPMVSPVRKRGGHR